MSFGGGGLVLVAQHDTYRSDVQGWLTEGGWRQTDDDAWSKGDLRVTATPYDVHPQDERASRDTPDGFCSLDVVFVSEDFKVTRTERQMPWNVLAGGIRIKDKRGNPAYADDLSELKNYCRSRWSRAAVRASRPACPRCTSRTRCTG